MVILLNERFGATKWPELHSDASLLTFLFSASKVRTRMSGGPAGDFGLMLVQSPVEMLMFGNEARCYCLVKFSLMGVEQGIGIQGRRESFANALASKGHPRSEMVLQLPHVCSDASNTPGCFTAAPEVGSSNLGSSCGQEMALGAPIPTCRRRDSWHWRARHATAGAPGWAP